MLGKQQQHIKFVLQDGEQQTKQLECIYFSPRDTQKELIKTGDTISILYTIEAQYWQGKKQLKCFIKAVTQVI